MYLKPKRPNLRHETPAWETVARFLSEYGGAYTGEYNVHAFELLAVDGRNRDDVLAMVGADRWDASA